MALYKLTGNDSEGNKIQTIVRTTDKASIPMDELNTDYQEYLKWLNGEDPYTEKGIPDPAE